MSAPSRTGARLDPAALAAPGRRPRVLVVVNPSATGVSDRRREVVLHALGHRYAVEAVRTEHRDHATTLARAAVEDGMDLVVAYGGDGTANEVANALAGTGTPMTPLPGGSANVFARLVGVPADVVDATQAVLRHADGWRARPVALGRVGERWFTFACGFGLDADVCRWVEAHPVLKRRLAPWIFAGAAVSTYLGRYLHDAPRLVVEGAGEPLALRSLVLQNGPHYTYFRRRPVSLVHGPPLERAGLRGVGLRRTRPTSAPGLLLRAFLAGPEVAGHRAATAVDGHDELAVRTLDGRPLSLQVDGDHVGAVRAASVRTVEAALHVVA